MPTAQDRRVPRIVVGVDGSPSSRQALRWAVHQAELTAGTVDAVIAWQYPAVIGGFGFAPGVMIDSADYAETSAKTLAEAVASTVSPDSNASIRQHCVHHAPCPVVVVRGDPQEPSALVRARDDSVTADTVRWRGQPG